MLLVRPCRSALLILVIAVNAGCGGSDKLTGPDKQVPAPNYVRLQSDAGDYIGDGRSYAYDQANAIIGVVASGGSFTISVNGDESWFGLFQTTTAASQLVRGTYPDGVDWFGEGRGCGGQSGALTIDSVTYVAGALTQVDLRFEQRCNGFTAALHGTIHWRADDTTKPPGPLRPIPTGLWQPPGAIPAGNYVYLQSDAGDYIGSGFTYSYDQGISVSSSGNRMSIAVADWGGDFEAMNVLDHFEQGYYGGLHRFPFNNPTKGGLSWIGNGRGCNTLTGWYAIDQITYSGTSITSIDLRFEQHCEGGTAALRGVVHWRA